MSKRSARARHKRSGGPEQTANHDHEPVESSAARCRVSHQDSHTQDAEQYARQFASGWRNALSRGIEEHNKEWSRRRVQRRFARRYATFRGREQPMATEEAEEAGNTRRDELSSRRTLEATTHNQKGEQDRRAGGAAGCHHE